MTEEEIQQLSKRFTEVQKVPHDMADDIADLVGHADDDIITAARIWLITGKMPNEPTIKGYTPVALANDYTPLQVFHFMVGLRTNPETTAKYIDEHPSPKAAQRQCAKEGKARIFGPSKSATPKESPFAIRIFGPEPGAKQPDYSKGPHKPEERPEKAELRKLLNGQDDWAGDVRYAVEAYLEQHCSYPELIRLSMLLNKPEVLSPVLGHDERILIISNVIGSTTPTEFLAAWDKLQDEHARRKARSLNARAHEERQSKVKKGVPMTPEELQILSQIFVERQEMTPERADEIAGRIAASDADIVDAARHWMATGSMPDTPVIEGRTPASLDKDYYPSQAFSILVEFRKDPAKTLQMLRHYPGRNVPPGARA